MRLSAEVLNLAEQRPNPLGERELLLRGRGIPLIEHLGVTRDAFDSIDFTDNRLTRLDNFPRLERLATLQLSNNAIETLDEPNLAKNLPNITVLNLSNNRIANLHQIDSMGKAFPKLEFLSLSGNPVTRKYKQTIMPYRKYVGLEHSQVADTIQLFLYSHQNDIIFLRSLHGPCLFSENEMRSIVRDENAHMDQSNPFLFLCFFHFVLLLNTTRSAILSSIYDSSYSVSKSFRSHSDNS
jgi:Leucine-rich repeat